MFEIVKLVMTAGGILQGYKTYIAAFFGFLAAFGGWGVDVLIPFIDGKMELAALVSMSSPYFTAMAGAFGLAGLRAAK